MKRPLIDLQFPTLDPSVAGRHHQGGVERLALLPYREVIDYLLHNARLPLNDPDKRAECNIQGYKVVLNSLKLRTFAHYHEQGEPCCSNPDCKLEPAYFVLERSRSHKHRARSGNNAAYLSLYGVDANGHEVEFTHDHTLARCFGGANALANTTVMCRPCNNQKSRIESRMHHRTLKVLREFLEDNTGQRADPHFLLERVRKAEYNLSTVSMQYDRVGVMPLSEVLHAIRNPAAPMKEWHGKKVKTNGVRLNAFAQQDHPCCQDPECGVAATHFAVERIAGKELNDDRGYHLNMYGKRMDGSEVQFSHHQVLHMGSDGSPNQLAVITLCNECKEKNLDVDNSVMASKITAAGGMTRSQWEDVDQNKKQTKVMQVAAMMQQQLGYSTLDELVAWCNQQGKLSAVKPKRSKVQTIVDAIGGFTVEGARWFKHQQKDLFLQQRKNPDQPLSEQEQQELLSQKIASAPKTRKIRRYAMALSRHLNVEEDGFVSWLEEQAAEQQISNDWNSSMNSISNVMNALSCTARAARLFQHLCGHILDVGPQAKNPGKDPHPLHQILVTIEDNRNNAPSLRRNKRLKKAWEHLHQWIAKHSDPEMTISKGARAPLPFKA